MISLFNSRVSWDYKEGSVTKKILITLYSYLFESGFRKDSFCTGYPDRFRSFLTMGVDFTTSGIHNPTFQVFVLILNLKIFYTNESFHFLNHELSLGHGVTFCNIMV